jgi:hypothetical protein
MRAYARWSPNRTSGQKYQHVPKFDTTPELYGLEPILEQLHREGLISFHRNKPLLLGQDVNGKPVWCIPDAELVTHTSPAKLMVIRVQGVKWHPEGDPKDDEQKQRLERLRYIVHDVLVPDSGRVDWAKEEREIREKIRA